MRKTTTIQILDSGILHPGFIPGYLIYRAQALFYSLSHALYTNQLITRHYTVSVPGADI